MNRKDQEPDLETVMTDLINRQNQHMTGYWKIMIRKWLRAGKVQEAAAELLPLQPEVRLRQEAQAQIPGVLLSVPNARELEP